MAAVVRLAVLLLAASTCTPTPTPPGPADAAPAPVVITPGDQQIYGALVEAGCMAASEAGAAAVAAERQQYGDLGLACMYDGGTIQSCKVPCNPLGVKVR